MHGFDAQVGANDEAAFSLGKNGAIVTEMRGTGSEPDSDRPDAIEFAAGAEPDFRF